MLQLLGDELIGSARLAVFELVKNAYDADATQVIVELDLTWSNAPSITVTDDGEGMDLETIQHVWLVPGDDHRQKQRKAAIRSPKHHRLPLGEKGLGRFAVHKLGNQISLVTRARRSDECIVNIKWSDLIEKPFLEDAPVEIAVREPEVFTRSRTGTRIHITELREEWPRGEVRRLHRQITSICSPFEETDGFKALLLVPGQEPWIADLPDVESILSTAFWKFTFLLENGQFEWFYEFRGVPGLKLDSRVVEQKSDVLKLPRGSGDKVVGDAELSKGIGPVRGEFYVYDRDQEILRRLPSTQLVSNYLDENGGIRVYRDGIRVYNYGEPGDDWLGLDLRRVNSPTRSISRNIVLGAVSLQLEKSTALVEKTNREGFVENDAVGRLKTIVLSALAVLESERDIDKHRIRTLTARASDPTVAKIEKPISDLRKALDRGGIRKKYEPYLTKIQEDYQDMQQTLLSAGMSGLNLAVIFHEVERGVRALHQVIVDGTDDAGPEEQARELVQLLDGFSTVLRRDSSEQHDVRRLMESARRFNAIRLRLHRIALTCPILDGRETSFEAKFSFNLVLGALNNLIDNSLYWLRIRWPELPAQGERPQRRLYIGVSYDLGPHPALVVADNGPGFQGELAERLVRPFFSRRPKGMGLGLYYANLAMELNGGQLLFPELSDVDLPAGFDGAVVALVFGGPTR